MPKYIDKFPRTSFYTIPFKYKQWKDMGAHKVERPCAKLLWLQYVLWHPDGPGYNTPAL